MNATSESAIATAPTTDHEIPPGVARLAQGDAPRIMTWLVRRPWLAASVRILGEDDAIGIGLLAVVEKANGWEPARGAWTTYLAWVAGSAIRHAAELEWRGRTRQLGDVRASGLMARDDEPPGLAMDIETLLRQMPGSQRQVMELRLEGKTHREIGEALGLTGARVQQIGQRVAERLRERAS